MNRIVREHYPVEKLPEDLREGLPTGRTVTVTLVEEEEAASEAITMDEIDAILRNAKPMTLVEIRARLHPKGLEPNEAVDRIRALRDEWD